MYWATVHPGLLSELLPSLTEPQVLVSGRPVENFHDLFCRPSPELIPSSD